VITDARRNLSVSMLIAGNYDIPEVCIFFNNALLRANRSTKRDNWGFSAFDSPNYPQLALLGSNVTQRATFCSKYSVTKDVPFFSIQVAVQSQLLRPPPRGRFRVNPSPLNYNVAVLHLVPGFSDAMVIQYFAPDRIEH
jgi:L-asparaginase/Glu-tRNA(Gln) amidotransferase subunit D